MTDHLEPIADGYLPLVDYPAALYQMERDETTLRIAVETAIHDRDTLALKYEAEAANSSDLTNGLKRKAYVENRKEESGAYQSSIEAVANAEAALRDHQHVSDRMRREFRVAQAVFSRVSSLVNDGIDDRD